MIKINLNKFELKNGDCLEQMRLLPENSVDSIVTDPPYGISFMGKQWDYDVPSKEVFAEMLRVLKPGGHALIACGTRTQHRMAVNIEDAGFEIRDVITWLYGSGFPKSMDISKAIDKQAGAEREVIGEKEIAGGIHRGTMNDDGWRGNIQSITTPSTSEAKQWQGWGTALKPACEFWTLARKPLSEKTVASNVLKHGTGGINIDGCRVGTVDKLGRLNHSKSTFNAKNTTPLVDNSKGLGRWPANLILDEGAAEIMGEPSRFFYVAKASKSERNQGCDDLELKEASHGKGHEKGGLNVSNSKLPNQNNHPTVKPIKLMTYLCRLITPPNGIVLDPFMGSGSTGVAAVKEGFGFIGIEREPQYYEICKARIENA